MSAVSTSMVRISEVMTSNASAVRADNGQFTDWVEVVNTGVTDVSLKGYTLLNADDALAPLTFPDITLAPANTFLFIAMARSKTPPATRCTRPSA